MYTSPLGLTVHSVRFMNAKDPLNLYGYTLGIILKLAVELGSGETGVCDCSMFAVQVSSNIYPFFHIYMTPNPILHFFLNRKPSIMN